MQIFQINSNYNDSVKVKIPFISNRQISEHSQIEEDILERLAGLLVQALAHQEGELVRVLAGGGDPHRARPVVVQVAQLVRQLLEVVWLQPGVVLDHVVGGGVDRPLPHRLRHEEEVVALRQGDDVVDHGAAGRVLGHGAAHLEDLGVDLLVDDDVGELDLIVRQPGLGHAGENGGQLVIHHVLNLPVPDTIPTIKAV